MHNVRNTKFHKINSSTGSKVIKVNKHTDRRTCSHDESMNLSLEMKQEKQANKNNLTSKGLTHSVRVRERIPGGQSAMDER
jgi:hypothetical protein